MNSLEFQELHDHYSPLASTEEKSIHDNINLNRQSLEKGLRNRPNHDVLVDRGILRNPGKAYSDKMSQLDLAKKRDKLKIKIANRPEREELIRKLILQEQNDNRQMKFDKIKELLDDSINHRPGSLELIEKNVLQVDRLLASRVQSGDITYPKVCEDGNYIESVSNHSTPLPSISEIDISNSLNELSGLKSYANSSGSKSNNNKNLQYKTTYRVGRYSFHNIEFRRSAQKAREYQQNQLVQFEEIQAQRNPNMKKIHSELAIKSQHNAEFMTSDTTNVTTKHSLLHRLNVHELKSECKIRMISCSNIPKTQLVEKLLPYESEILASHTSFDSLNRNLNIFQSNRRSMPVIKSTRDFSPPEMIINSNSQNSFGQLHQSSGQLINQNFESIDCSKMIHSHSEPLIQNYINSSQPISILNTNSFFPSSSSVQNPNYDYINISNGSYISQPSSFSQFNMNNSYSALNCNQSNVPFSPNNHSLIIHPNVLDSSNMNGWSHLTNHSSQQPNINSPVIQSDAFNHHHDQNQKNMKINSHSDILLTNRYLIPPLSNKCGNKFDVIINEVSSFISFIENLKLIRIENHCLSANHYIDQFHTYKMNIIKLINEMMELINKEIKFKTIDISSAQLQQNWLKSLLISVNNNFQSPNVECVKMESDYPEYSDDLVNNDNRVNFVCFNNAENKMETMNAEKANVLSNNTSDDNLFLECLGNGHSEELDQLNLSETPIPASPLSDLVNSPLLNDDLDDFMNELLNITY